MNQRPTESTKVQLMVPIGLDEIIRKIAILKGCSKAQAYLFIVNEWVSLKAKEELTLFNEWGKA